MDWKTFIAEVLKALSWPLAVIVVSAMFRSELKTLLKRVKRGKGLGMEWEFEEAMAQATAEAPPSGPPVSPEVEAVAAQDPRGVIITSWLSLERAATQLLVSRGLGGGFDKRQFLNIGRSLLSEGLIEEKEFLTLEMLRKLRAAAAHNVDFAPNASSVAQYVALAEGLKEKLTALHSQPGSVN